MKRSFLDRFVEANQRLCRRLEPPFVSRTHAQTRFVEEVDLLIRAAEEQVVADVGAGRTCHFDAKYKGRYVSRVIGLDVSGDEMAHNPLLDERIVTDVCESIPLPGDSVDLIVVRSTIEHLHDNVGFARNAFRILRPGGRLVVCFSNRYAPFAVLNRMLPNRFSKRILHALIPGSKGYLGFPAFYDRCYPPAYDLILVRQGFRVREAYHSYYGSYPFRFFFPLWVFSMIIDSARHLLKWQRFCSHNFYLAEKPVVSNVGGSRETREASAEGSTSAVQCPPWTLGDTIALRNVNLKCQG